MIGGQLIQERAIASPLLSKQNRYTCVGCRIKFDSSESQRNHFKTEWHLYNLKRRVCNLGPIDSDSFQLIQASAPTREIAPTPSKSESIKSHPITSGSSNVDAPTSQSQEDDEDWDDVDEDELVDEDYDEKEAAEMLARVVKSDTCLFCDKKNSNTENNVKHMNLIHGFFIPEEQYLIDLEGLLEYIGFKVGAGATCLWCSKQFTTLHGARLHMLYKDHCKIYFDQEKAVDEFKEFYDYSTQEHIEMKPLSQLAVPKKRSEARAEYNRSLAKTRLNGSGGNQIIAKKSLAMIPGSYQAKNIKKFNAYRAKIILRTGMANNYTMRGRLRQQNPI